MTLTASDLDGWKHCYSGKVRELYRHPDRPGEVLVVASDRISAYDHVLSTPIPDKGKVLTALTLWWFEQLKTSGIPVGTHVISTQVPGSVVGRAMICQDLHMFPVECVARGYLTGSGLADYRATGAVCGVELPPGLTDGSRLPTPIFTPATKAEVGEHDENVTFAQAAETVGFEVAEKLREVTLQVYEWAEAVARERGIIVADTKFEFGSVVHHDGGGHLDLVLGDEVLTPDSSRFWPVDLWEPGHSQASFDKQFVRDWLCSPESGWDRHGTDAPPQLPQEVVDRTRERYVQAYEVLTGQQWSTT